MNEDVVEKLIQKAAGLIDTNVDLNAQIQGFMTVKETISGINGRIDSILGSIKQMEKGVQLDENKLRQLEGHSEAIKEGLQVFKQTADGLKTAVQRLEDRVCTLEEQTQSAGRFIGGLRWRVSIMWITHIITAAFLVAMFLLLKIH